MRLLAIARAASCWSGLENQLNSSRDSAFARLMSPETLVQVLQHCPDALAEAVLLATAASGTSARSTNVEDTHVVAQATGALPEESSVGPDNAFGLRVMEPEALLSPLASYAGASASVVVEVRGGKRGVHRPGREGQAVVAVTAQPPPASIVVIDENSGPERLAQVPRHPSKRLSRQMYEMVSRGRSASATVAAFGIYEDRDDSGSKVHGRVEALDGTVEVSARFIGRAGAGLWAAFGESTDDRPEFVDLWAIPDGWKAAMQACRVLLELPNEQLALIEQAIFSTVEALTVATVALQGAVNKSTSSAWNGVGDDDSVLALPSVARAEAVQLAQALTRRLSAKAKPLSF